MTNTLDRTGGNKKTRSGHHQIRMSRTTDSLAQNIQVRHGTGALLPALTLSSTTPATVAPLDLSPHVQSPPHRCTAPLHRRHVPGAQRQRQRAQRAVHVGRCARRWTAPTTTTCRWTRCRRSTSTTPSRAPTSSWVRAERAVRAVRAACASRIDGTGYPPQRGQQHASLNREPLPTLLQPANASPVCLNLHGPPAPKLAKRVPALAHQMVPATCHTVGPWEASAAARHGPHLSWLCAHARRLPRLCRQHEPSQPHQLRLLPARLPRRRRGRRRRLRRCAPLGKPTRGRTTCSLFAGWSLTAFFRTPQSGTGAQLPRRFRRPAAKGGRANTRKTPAAGGAAGKLNALWGLQGGNDGVGVWPPPAGFAAEYTAVAPAFITLPWQVSRSP